MALNISSISEIIKAATNVGQTVQAPLPLPLVLAGASSKEGISTREIVKAILQRKQEIGAPTGNLPDGSESIDDKMVYIIVDEIVKHLLTNGRINVVIPPGSILINGACVTPTGGGTITGTNTNPVNGFGIIQ